MFQRRICYPLKSTLNQNLLSLVTFFGVITKLKKIALSERFKAIEEKSRIKLKR
jgi:hypothetical protein